MEIELTHAARKIIKRLLDTGLYGQHEADVCERLFYEKLRELDSRSDDGPPPAVEPCRGKR